MKYRLLAAIAALRGRSVAYRMRVTPQGMSPLTDHAVIVMNEMGGDWSNGTTWVDGIPPTASDDVIVRYHEGART